MKLLQLYSSSIGKKFLVAITGLILLLFLFGHMAGNLLIYAGQDALNTYAVQLKSLLHGSVVWGSRFVLLGSLIIHVVTTILLVRENRAARLSRYAHEATVGASRASRTMIISGLILLSFIVFHILTLTILPGPGDQGYYEAGSDPQRHDVYGVVIRTFSNPLISLFYIVSMVFLCFHLSHGFSSVFQTLGLRTERSWPFIVMAGKAYALLILIGNCSIPLAVLLGFVE